MRIIKRGLKRINRMLLPVAEVSGLRSKLLYIFSKYDICKIKSQK